MTAVSQNNGPLSSCDCIYRRFELQTDLSPDSIAVVFEAEHLSYRELNESANQLANYLVRHGVDHETLVGVYMQPSLDLVVTLLAILKAGGAYVPLEPTYPHERLALIAEDAGLTHVIKGCHSMALGYAAAVTIALDANQSAIARESRENLQTPISGDSLAYIIYTSGSTGQPKGVQVIHRAVVHLIEAATPLLQCSRDDTWTVFHSFAFDFSVWEIFGCLLTGGTLVVVPRELVKSPSEFLDLLARERVSVLNQTPSALRQLLYAVRRQSEAAKRLALRLIVCGGESLPGELGRELLSLEIPVWNFYGPTETTVWASAMEVRQEDCEHDVVPIGYALPGMELVVATDDMQPAAAGSVGDLYIGGSGLARGYLNRPDLTNSKFVRVSFDDRPPSRFYRTGDRGRELPDGRFEFLGRRDNQVKIRGHRVELGEIESVLRKHPAVAEAVVLLRETMPESESLIAYLTTREGADEPSHLALRTFLSRTLPEYMLPSSYRWLEQIPLTENGKIDRGALAAVETVPARTDVADTKSADPVQRQLKSIWQEALGIDVIGLHENFFDIGGHSLMAVHIFTAIEKWFGVRLPLATLFQAPRIAELAEVVRRRHSSSSWPSLVAIEGRGSLPPLFVVHAIGGNVLSYSDLASHLRGNLPLYAFQAQGVDGRTPPYSHIEEMAAHYIREMQAFQPNGPYYIGGESFGGVVAYEMAQQLVAKGETVGLLVFFDASPYHDRALREKVAGHLQLLARLGPVRGSIHALKTIKHVVSPTPPILPTPDETNASVLNAWDQITELNASAHQNYRPKPYHGHAILFRAQESPWSGDIGWRKLILGTVTVREVPGDHLTFMNDPHVKLMADELQAFVRQTTQFSHDHVPALQHA